VGNGSYDRDIRQREPIMNDKNDSPIKLSDIKKILHAEVVVGHDQLDLTIRAGISSDLMSDIMWGPTDGAVLLTGLNNLQAVRSSVISGVVAMVLVRGKEPAQEVVEQARSYRFPLLSTPFSMYSACGRLFSRGLRGVELKRPRTEAQLGK
jgi:predicted transcriptional regulator